jgi:hypothetical protein
MKIHSHNTLYRTQKNPWKTECGLVIKAAEDSGWTKKRDMFSFITTLGQGATCKNCLKMYLIGLKRYAAKKKALDKVAV